MSSIMLLVISLATWIGGCIFLQKKMGISRANIATLICGSCFFSALDGVAKIIIGLILFSGDLMLSGLVSALISGVFAYISAKRAGLL